MEHKIAAKIIFKSGILLKNIMKTFIALFFYFPAQ
jgi:hypothetical protein